MWNVHPKYLKIKKLGFIRRCANAIMVFFASWTTAIAYILRSPINGLEAFFVTEEEVVDRQKMIDDALEQENKAKEKKSDDGEDWKSQHKELYE